jgi:hypothetical protein
VPSLALLLALASGCSAAGDDDSGGADAGADEEGYGEYDGESGTGAGADSKDVSKTATNTVTFYGASGLYSDLRRYLTDLYQQKRTADYYRPARGRGHVLRNPANVYVSPEVDTDLVTHRLDDLTPTASRRR